MSGQKKSYDRYLESLKNTPGPVDPPLDRTVDLRGLYEYLNRTGKNASELSVDERNSFIIYLNTEKLG